jgi:putative flippase GtrA
VRAITPAACALKAALKRPHENETCIESGTLICMATRVGEWAVRLWSFGLARYLLVGVINTAFGYSIFAFFVLLHLHYAVAAFLSTALGMLFNFKTTGVIVFKSRDNRRIMRFSGVYGITYVLAIAVLKVFKALGVHVLVTAAVMALPMAALSFFLMRRFVFERGSRLDGVRASY